MPGSNQRAYTRVPLRLDARISGPSWSERAGQVRDFCPGGVFLACSVEASDPGPEVLQDGAGMAATLAFEIGPRRYSIRARIVRAFDAGLGLAFVDPDPAALAALQDQADRQREEAAARTGGNPALDEATRSRLLARARDLSTAELAALLRRFFGQAEAALLEAARISSSSNEQQAFFEALNALEGGQPAVQSAFGALVERHFDEFGRPLAAVEKPPEDTPGGLSLVDKDDFEDFLVISELSARLESQNDERLSDLNRRFDNLCDVRIGNENNPVGPVAVCHAFRAALRELGMPPGPMRVAYRAFAELVGRGLASLYGALTEYLESENLAPVPRPSEEAPPRPVVRPAAARSTSGAPDPHAAGGSGADPSSTAERRAPAAEPRAAGAEAGRGAGSAPAAGAGQVDDRGPPPVGETVEAPFMAPVSGPSDEFPARPPAPVMPAAVHSVPAAPHQVGAGAAFGAAQAMLGIRRAQHGHGAAYVPDEGESAADRFSTEEVLAAISALPPPDLHDGANAGEGIAAGGGAGLRDRILSLLGSTPGGRQVGDDLLDTIDLVESLFAAFAEDAHLPVPLKPRVARLEPAVQRRVLVEPAVLNQRDHPVRRFLNALAEVDEGPSAGAQHPGVIEETVDPIVDRVVAESEQDPGAFDLACDLIDALLEAQQEERARNRARVVEQSEAQQALLKQRRAADAGRRREEGVSTGSQEWGVWLGRASRLQAGDRIELDDGARKRTLELAWIGEGFNPFVLVDRRGEKAASLSLPELAMNLRRGQAVVRDRPQLSLVDRAMYRVLYRMHQRIEREATHDRLTGAGDRRTLEAAVEQALKSAASELDREHALCVVAFEDLDEVHRRGGEMAVDGVLREAVRVLGAAVPGTVEVGKLDDAAYGFVLEDIGSPRLERTVQRIQQAIDDHVFDAGSERYFLRLRAGVVPLAYPVEDAVQALTQALDACERAAALDGRLEVVDRAPSAGGAGMMDWVTLINRTLGEDRMQLRCQLVRPLGQEDGRRSRPYWEVLLGLRDDEDQAVAPADFIAALEYYEQMAALDRWVIRNALKWMGANRKAVRDAAGFTIKLTRHSLQDEHLMEYVLEQLTATSVPPGKICFEITQADAAAHLEQATRLVRTLREFGCRFSLSKFGGQPTSEDLQSLPVDFLKIDGRFVRGIATRPDDFAVVQSATHLAHAYGMRAVAEFVEEDTVLEQLEAIGVDLVQGLAVQVPQYLSDLAPEPAPGPTPGSGAAPSAPPAAAADGWEDDLEDFLGLGESSPGKRDGGSERSATGAPAKDHPRGTRKP